MRCQDANPPRTPSKDHPSNLQELYIISSVSICCNGPWTIFIHSIVHAHRFLCQRRKLLALRRYQLGTMIGSELVDVECALVTVSAVQSQIGNMGNWIVDSSAKTGYCAIEVRPSTSLLRIILTFLTSSSSSHQQTLPIPPSAVRRQSSE